MTIPAHWRMPSLALVLVVCVCLLVFQETWLSIVGIWERSETFAHGYLVAPTSAWLIWRKQADYRDLSASFSGLAFICLLGLGLLWLSADLVSVLVIRQWAVVGILVCAVWTVLGNRVTSSILFPLLFLFLMVPFGEEFVPYLMNYTSAFIVTMLRLTGISVYQEGTFLTLSSGEWSVVEGCSGLRYLIASFTLGTVYAYLNYQSYIKRAVFMLIAFLLPIFANGLRAYMIVMIGHWSDMKLATGVDHIIYGWVFFGFVMLLLFYIGSFWQDSPTIDSTPSTPAIEHGVAIRSNLRWQSVICLALAIAAWPVLSSQLRGLQAIQAEIPGDFAARLQTASPVAPDWGWKPSFKGVMADVHFFVVDDTTKSAVYIANFGDESQGGELVNSQNYLVPQKHPVWHIIRSEATHVQGDGGPRRIEETILSSDTRDILVWRWYRIGGIDTINRYYIKGLQLLKRLTGNASPELMIILYTETPHGETQSARNRLVNMADTCCF